MILASLKGVGITVLNIVGPWLPVDNMWIKPVYNSVDKLWITCGKVTL